MSTKSDDGGAAFPTIPPLDPDGGTPPGYPFPEHGMTLRDWYAGQIAGHMIGGATLWLPTDSPQEVARDAYAVADALIAERNKGR